MPKSELSSARPRVRCSVRRRVTRRWSQLEFHWPRRALTGVRGRSISPDPLTRAEIEARKETAWYDPREWRPRVRSECLPGGRNEMRPCPFASCKHHLAYDVKESNGSLKRNFPHLEIWEMEDTCSLDVAAPGQLEDPNCTSGEGLIQEEVGVRLNLTTERIQQIDALALQAMHVKMRRLTK